MPASADVKTPVLREITAQAPRVFIEGIEYSGMTCLAVEDTMGAHPSTALLRLSQVTGGTTATDLAGPVTLNRMNWPWKYGARVVVLDAVTERPVFCGSISGRKDQGEADTVLWECLDDRELLRRIPIRGAFVYDANDSGAVKFLSRYSPRCNPSGAWNCTWGTVNGQIVPMFTTVANQNQQRQSYTDAQRQTYTPNNVTGALSPWTPRLWLQYLRWVLYESVGALLPGWSYLSGGATADPGCRGIASRLQWPANSISTIKGVVDPANPAYTDPLDRALPDLAWKGSALDVLTRALEIAGTHALVLDYVQNGAGWDSVIRFAPIGQTALSAANQDALVLPLYRGGTPPDCNSVYDFEVSEEPPDADAVLTEGQPVREETAELWFNAFSRWPVWQANTAYPADALVRATASDTYGYKGTAGTSGGSEPSWGATTTDNTITWTRQSAPTVPANVAAIEPVWTTTTETYAQMVIAGDGTNAYRPSTEGGAPNTVVSGTAANSKEAVALARSLYPDWRTRFRLSGSTLVTDTLSVGYDGRYASENLYPFHHGARPILPELLQWFLADGALATRVPVRVQVYQNGGWIEAPRENGIVLLPDGTFLLTGIADNMDGASEQTPTVGACLWNGSVAVTPAASAPQFLQMTLAYTLDHRVRGYAVTPVPSYFEESYQTALGGPPLAHIEATEGWREDHQYKSKPFASGTGAAAYANTGETVNSDGITGLLPPGSESVDALDTATRQCNTACKPKRRSSWKMPGIRPEWRAGQWLGRVQVLQGATGDTDYEIDSPIGTVLYDYLHQQTIIGGLLSLLPSYAAPVGRGVAPPMMP